MKKRQTRLLFLASTAILLAGCASNLQPMAIIAVDHLQGYPPLEIAFDGSGSQGVDSSLVSFHWDFDDGTTAQTSTVTHVFENKGTFDVILTVTDARGSIGSTAKTIHVLNRVPHADFRITPFGAPRDYPVQFDASESDDPDGEIVSYLWDFGDGASAEGMNVEHIFPQQQTEYLVTLTITDDDGASNSAIRRVVVLGCDTCG
ncbi:PKD domain-containing protein [Candidatus Bipolaricaulota bacterium]|nr:PKD domain-containing protein [Candidatus Bipolaricaulota bacterium]